MIRKLFIGLTLALLLLPVVTAHAQETTPADLVRAFLEGMGYNVLDVGYWLDENNNPDPNIAAFEVELDSSATATQQAQAIVLGYAALRKAFPDSSGLIALIKVQNLIYIFPAEASVYDQWTNGQITDAQFGQYLTSKSKVFDLTTKSYVTPGTPGGTASPDKSQTDKNFQGSENQQLPCNPAAGKAWFWIRNGYMGKDLDFTIGGGEWSTHDYKIPGTGEWKYIEMPPGRYTWSAHIAGVGVAHGERFDYAARNCYYQNFSPN